MRSSEKYQHDKYGMGHDGQNQRMQALVFNGYNKADGYRKRGGRSGGGSSRHGEPADRSVDRSVERSVDRSVGRSVGAASRTNRPRAPLGQGDMRTPPPILKRHLRGMRRGSISAAEYFQVRQAAAEEAAAADRQAAFAGGVKPREGEGPGVGGGVGGGGGGGVGV
jgi:hypothetical protein